MPVLQNDFLYPIALKHLSKGRVSKAQECFQKALPAELTPQQIKRFAHTTAAWVMNQVPEKRNDMLNAVTDQLNPDIPSHATLARKILNQAHHAWSFDAYFSGRWPEVGPHVVETLMTQPSLFRNRGLMSIWVRSMYATFVHPNRRAPATSSAHTEDCDIAASDRARVEALLSHPVHHWQPLEQSSPYAPRFRVYSFRDAGHQHVARIATSGSIVPALAVMEEVFSAGVPAPEIRLDVEGSKTASGVRVETFIAGEHLHRFANRNGIAGRIIDQLGESFQRLHSIQASSFGSLNHQAAAAPSTFHTVREEIEQKVFGAFLDDAVPEQATQLAAQLLNDLENSPYEGLPRVCHCDLHPENILVQNDKLSGLIDWEFAQGHDPAYDVAQFLAFGIEFWEPHASDAFIGSVIAASTPSDHKSFLQRVKTYLPLCVMDLLPTIAKFSLPHPWRNAGKMQRYLFASIDNSMQSSAFASC